MGSSATCLSRFGASRPTSSRSDSNGSSEKEFLSGSSTAIIRRERNIALHAEGQGAGLRRSRARPMGLHAPADRRGTHRRVCPAGRQQLRPSSLSLARNGQLKAGNHQKDGTYAGSGRSRHQKYLPGIRATAQTRSSHNLDDRRCQHRPLLARRGSICRTELMQEFRQFRECVAHGSEVSTRYL